jgi:hypothetical protein
MVRLAKECSNALRLACTEYNLAKTTSVDEACQNPSTAFATEFSRLLQRKKTLLAEGNQEYYETFILKRWDSVQNGLTTVCSDSSLYLEELSKQGIDVEELTKTLKASCSACVTKPNDIRQ